MIYSSSRISWDTNFKHYIPNGLYDNLPNTIKARIPKSNKHLSHCTATKLKATRIELIKSFTALTFCDKNGIHFQNIICHDSATQLRASNFITIIFV